MDAALLRAIPQVERVLQERVLQDAAGRLPRSLLVRAVREVLEDRRRRLTAGEGVALATEDVADAALVLAEALASPGLVRVVNATGVVLHTNLGRAPLAPEAVEAMVRAAGYCNLEYDLAAGRRGDRHDAVGRLLVELTGAEAALVVNNNAAAVLLALAALARGREVVVGRGELVEIGGAFRIPDVLVQSGARLREVGTTNRTRLGDYEAAVGPDTGLLLKVHTSNYRILGFTAEVGLAELVGLGRRLGLPVVQDLGSGSLVDLAAFGLEREPTVPEAVASGADLITFSGDKLLGGPQAGIVVGRQSAVAACARHPLMRALRPDKVTLAALEATLALYRDRERSVDTVPALRALVVGQAALRPRAEALGRAVAEAVGAAAEVRVREERSEVGGGSLPLQELPTWAVEVRGVARSAADIEAALRRHSPPVVARIREGAVLFDVRTLAEGDERDVVAALCGALREEEAS